MVQSDITRMVDLSESLEGTLFPVTPSDVPGAAHRYRLVTEGAIKEIFNWPDEPALAECIQNSLPLYEALVTEVQTLPKHSGDTPHPLQLLCIQGPGPEELLKTLSLLQSYPVEEHVFILQGLWETRFSPAARNAEHPALEVSCENLSKLGKDFAAAFPGEQLSIDLYSHALVIQELSSRPIKDLAFTVSGVSRSLSMTLAPDVLRSYYAAGHRFIVDPNLLDMNQAPRAALESQRIVEVALARYRGASDPRSEEVISDLARTLSRTDRAHVGTILDRLSHKKLGLGHLADLLAVGPSAKPFISASLAAVSRMPAEPLFRSLRVLSIIAAKRDSLSVHSETLRQNGIRALSLKVREDREVYRPRICGRALKGLYAEVVAETAQRPYAAKMPELDKVEQLYRAILLGASTLYRHSLPQLREQLKDLRTQVTSGELGQDVAQTRFFMIAREIMYRTRGVYPYHGQMYSALFLTTNGADGERGRLAQVPTGEGKSLSIALSAGYLGFLGHRVDVVTSNGYLAARDRKEYEPFFRQLGLSAGTFTGREKLRKAIDPHILYTTCDAIGFAELRSMTGDAPLFSHQRFDICICDEADSLLVDSATNSLRLAGRGGALVDRRFFETLIVHVDQCDDHGREPDNLMIRAQPGLPGLISDARVQAYVRAVRESRSLIPEKDYVVLDQQIVPVDWQNSGRLRPGVHFGLGIQECLCIRNNLPLPGIVGNIAQISIPSLFDKYQKLILQSGTFGADERAEICGYFNLRGIDLPRRNASSLQSRAPRWIPSEAEWTEALIERSRAIHQENPDQPVLIAVGTIQQAQKLSTLLRGEGLTVQSLTDFDNRLASGEAAEEDQIVAHAGEAGMFTVTTSVGGRGVDIRLSQQALAAGGLHVIVGFYATSERIEQQLIGRAGRGGSPGSSESILCIEADPFIQSLPAPVVSSFFSVLNELGDTDPFIETLTGFLRRSATAIEIEKRTAVRERAAIAYAGLERFLERSQSITDLSRSVQVRLERDWIGIGEALEAGFAYGPDTSVALKSEIPFSLRNIYREAFGHSYFSRRRALPENCQEAVEGMVTTLATQLLNVTRESGQQGGYDWETLRQQVRQDVDRLFGSLRSSSSGH